MNADEKRREFEKFKDEAVIFREREAAVASMNFATFVSAIGPMGIGLLNVTQSLPAGPFLTYLILGSSPLGLVMMLINLARCPADYRWSKPILKCVGLSIIAAMMTWALSFMFPLNPAPPPPPPPPPPVVQ